MNGGRKKAKAAASVGDLVRRVFLTKHNLQLEPNVIGYFEEIFDAVADDLKDEETGEWDEPYVLKQLEKFVKGCQGNGVDAPKTISIALIKDVYNNLREDTGVEQSQRDPDELASRHFLDFVDAFDMPAYRWHEEAKVFQKAPKASLAPAPTGKAQYMRDRYNIIKQTILRDEHFSPPTIPGQERAEYLKLTTIKNLLGRQGSHFLIFGCLARMEDGAFYLEDLDDKVELDLSDVSKEAVLFTEGQFVLVDGDYTLDSVFKVNELGQPPSEPRENALKIFGNVDFLGVGALDETERKKRLASERAPSNETSFAIFSDVHLDNSRTMEKLATVLEVYENMDPHDSPSLFVFFGNFRSRPFLFDGQSSREYEELFTKFGRLLNNYPTLMAHSHFLMIPGPTDPYTAQVLPQPALPSTMTRDLQHRVPNLTLGSNPCRIRYFSQEIVLYRDDVMSRMMRNTIQEGVQREEKDRKKMMIQVIMDQAHLAPLPLSVRPIYWEFDHALRLYPMPTALIMADKYEAYHFGYSDCAVINPGPCARKNFSWNLYYPHIVDADERTEECELPDE
ncbi:hypothetical protein RQP46_001132 [Phenoliferia psychrophenolica]